MNKNYILLFLLLLLCLPVTSQKPENLKEQLEKIIISKKAQIGIAVIINGKDTITINNNFHYPMMSVFKFHQALAVVHYLEQKKLPLTTLVHIAKSDLHTNTYSPLRDRYPQGDINISIKELLIYTLQLSDNNACDILFDYIGGVKKTDDYIRSLGIENFSIAATEYDMHCDLQLCYQNWTHPLDAAHLLEILITRPIFTENNRTFIKHTMMECKTGKDRLLSPLLKTGALIGHKTGTGDRNEKGQFIGVNDIGFVFLPDGRRYTIAVFVTKSEENGQNTEQIIADISAAVYRYVMQCK